MQESTITAKGQTTVPREVRNALGLAPGDRVRYLVLEGEVRLLKVRPVSELAGLLARPGRTAVSLEEMDTAIAAGAAEGVDLRGMIALDTNVLVRYLTRDDPAQAAVADKVIAGLAAEAPGFICREVIVELVWVLERRYRVPRAEIASALEALLAAAEIAVEAAGDVGAALFRYRDDGLGFADLMIAAAARRAGASKLVTFDRRAARIEGVELIPA